jgi:hypothetical protein
LQAWRRTAAATNPKTVRRDGGSLVFMSFFGSNRF